MPLHRGPHPRYSEVVIVRVRPVEAGGSLARRDDEEAALAEALLRQLLQADRRRRVLLTRKDAIGSGL
jgi:hypothetical protein